MAGALTLREGELTEGACPNCGRPSATAWGFIEQDAVTLAAYFVTWAPGGDHDAHVDLVLGAWEAGTTPEDRVLVAGLLRPHSAGFVLIDASERPASARPDLAGHALRGEQVAGSALEPVARDLAAHVVQHDGRLGTLRAQMGDA